MPKKKPPRPKKPRKPRPSRATMPKERAEAIRNANLKPPKPGEVRNKLGKNGYETLKAFRDFFAEVIDEAEGERLPKGAPTLEPGDTRFRMLLKSLLRNALGGSDQSIKVAVEQLQGRPRQHIEVTGDRGNGPVVQFMLPPNGRDVAPTRPAGGAPPEDETADDADHDDPEEAPE
jgi:hypothetical protein